MLLVAKVLLGVLAGVMVMLWFRWTFKMKDQAAEHGIEAVNATGANFIRGDIGGLLLALAILIVLFLLQGGVWAMPIVIIAATVILGRVYSLVADGFSKPGLQAIIAEVISIALVLYINSAN